MLDWIFEGIVTWISSVVSQMMDAVSGLFLEALGTSMLAMEEYLQVPARGSASDGDAVFADCSVSCKEIPAQCADQGDPYPGGQGTADLAYLSSIRQWRQTAAAGDL